MEINKDELRYRRACADDVDALVECRIRFMNELFAHPEDEESEMLKKELRAYFSKAIASGEFVAWIAERCGKVVSTSGMVVWQIPPRYGLVSGRLGYILNMYTVPEERKQGVCTRLLNELIKEARALELAYLHLNASDGGVSIYKRAGFVEPDQIELELRMEGLVIHSHL